MTSLTLTYNKLSPNTTKQLINLATLLPVQPAYESQHIYDSSARARVLCRASPLQQEFSLPSGSSPEPGDQGSPHPSRLPAEISPETESFSVSTGGCPAAEPFWVHVLLLCSPFPLDVKSS